MATILMGIRFTKVNISVLKLGTNISNICNT